jgi:hypothetical protein
MHVQLPHSHFSEILLYQGCAQHLELKPTVGQSKQLLYQRQRVGTDVRPGVSLLSLLGARVPESAPLDRQSLKAAGKSVSPIHERLYKLRRFEGPSGNPRFA